LQEIKSPFARHPANQSAKLKCTDIAYPKSMTCKYITFYKDDTSKGISFHFDDLTEPV
jgi:hypothetical protein